MLKYEGDPIRDIKEYGECLAHPEVRCKIGWCHKVLQVKLALDAILDKRIIHIQVNLGKEFAYRVPPRNAPFERARSVVYADNISQVVVTDYVIVACCSFMGSVLM